MTNAFLTRVDQLTQLRRSRIGFGLARIDRDVLDHLASASEFADIVLVGTSELEGIKGFEVILDKDPEKRIVSLLVKGEVEGIIRGTLDDFITRELYTAMTGVQFSVEPALIRTPRGEMFFITPVSNREGWQKDERLDLAVGAADFLKDWGLDPDIAVFAPARERTYYRTRTATDSVSLAINTHYEEANSIAEALCNKGFKARNWGIDLDKAATAGCNILVPVNGVVGNQIVRSILMCGGQILAAPCLGLPHCYEDNSRNEVDFIHHVRWLNAWINSRERP